MQVIWGNPCAWLNRSLTFGAQRNDDRAEFVGEFEPQKFAVQTAFEPGLCRPGLLQFPSGIRQRNPDGFRKRFAEGMGDEQCELAVFRGA